MATETRFQLQCHDTGRWLIWDHQDYRLAHRPGDVCMGCLVQALTTDAAARVRDQVQHTRHVGSSRLNLVPVQVEKPRVSHRQPLWRTEK